LTIDDLIAKVKVMTKESVDLPGELGDDPRDEQIARWVDVNLVWSSHSSENTEDQKAFYRENDEFLVWYKAERIKRFGDSNPHLDWRDIERVEQAAPELRERERFHDPQWLADIKAKYDDTAAIQLAEHRHRVGLEGVWASSDPTVQAWNERVHAFHVRERERQFRSHPMCQPGVLIEVITPTDDGEQKERFLIGDINQVGGQCDDCSIPSDTRVLRYLDLRPLIQRVS
jgi:hypothetical protein